MTTISVMNPTLYERMYEKAKLAEKELNDQLSKNEKENSDFRKKYKAQLDAMTQSINSFQTQELCRLAEKDQQLKIDHLTQTLEKVNKLANVIRSSLIDWVQANGGRAILQKEFTAIGDDEQFVTLIVMIRRVNSRIFNPQSIGTAEKEALLLAATAINTFAVIRSLDSAFAHEMEKLTYITEFPLPKLSLKAKL